MPSRILGNRKSSGRVQEMVNNQFNGSTPVGYDALVAKFNLQVIPNWHHSRTNQSSIRETHTETGQVVEVYPSRYGRGLGAAP